MKQKVFLQLMVLVLGFSYIFLSLDATPLSRSLKLAVDQDLPAQEFVEEAAAWMEAEEEEGLKMYRRMDLDTLESDDYPGTGANNHHDPKPPGRT